MQIEKMKVSDLKYAPYNPRKIDEKELAKLKRSISEFGYVEPIVWNERTGFVVGGNQRLKALRELGIEEVDVVVVDLDDAKEKALNVALNKISGEWDFIKLKDVLTDIDTGDFDIELTGFDLDEIADLITFDKEPEEDGFDTDTAIEEIEEPKTKRGDIYLLGKHRLMCGDSTVKEDVEKLMDGKKAELGLCDPPYNVGLNYETYDDSLDTKQYKEFNKNWFVLLQKNTAKQIVTPGAANESLWVTLCVPYHIAPWVKTNALTNGKISHFMCAEPILFYGEKWGKKRASDVFDFPIGSQKGVGNHPCPKPLKLFADLISNYSEADDLVLDLFGGSGSTLIACEQLNRICYMMELDERYCDVIVRRREEFTGKKAQLIRK